MSRQYHKIKKEVQIYQKRYFCTFLSNQVSSEADCEYSLDFTEIVNICLNVKFKMRSQIILVIFL